MSLGYDQFVVLYNQLGGIAGIEGAIQHSLSHGVLHLIPVSYTHLDVYKRQGQGKRPHRKNR